MGQHVRAETFSGAISMVSASTGVASVEDADLVWPFGHLEGLDNDDIREAAYEVFFTACRSSPGFGGGKNALSFYSREHRGGGGEKNGGGDRNSEHHHHHHDGGEGGGSSGGSSGSERASGSGTPGGRVVAGPVVIMTPTSRIKKALGLKMLKRSPSRRMSTGAGPPIIVPTPGSPSTNVSASPGMGFTTVPGPSRPRRPMTSAEIMRLQMGVTEQSDNRLRKTLMRTLVGQTSKRAETIILPLELLRHLKPSEFNDSKEYHFWQRRQLKIMEAGLILHPAIPLDKSNTYALRFREIARQCEYKPIDTSKNSDTMRTLCNCIVSLSWRSANGNPADTCHWADGFPINIHIYVSLLRSIFDFRDETLVLDEVDELVELMKKTWTTLGINRAIHNLCFTWVFFQQYVLTGQSEPDLLYATHAMLSTEVANDAKKPDREAVYVKLLSSMLASMQGWAEKRLLHYHDYFQRGVLIENLMPLALSASSILGDDVSIAEVVSKVKGDAPFDCSPDRADFYIRASIKNAFAKIIETGSYKSTSVEVKDEATEALLQLATETEDLALRERQSFSPILKKWLPTAASVAALTLHQCYGAVLKQYLSGMTALNSDTVEVLNRAAKLEKMLVQMVVEDSAEYEDGGKNIVRQMVPYEVEAVILRQMGQWINGKLRRGKECLLRAKECETWNPKSKNEPYAQSAVELMKIAQDAADEFFQIPVGISNELVYELAEGLEKLFKDYINLVTACGSKQSYLPSLPPLTRCNSDSRFLKLWKKATPCAVSSEVMQPVGPTENHHPRPSTSRGTQRLYIRLNTLHYLQSHIHSLDKTLALAPRTAPSARAPQSDSSSRVGNSSSYFDQSLAAIHTGAQHVSEVAAYRLIFLDSNSVFYETLYVGDVANARIKPALRILKQNLTLMSAILTDRAQNLAIREVMKASFEAFLMVLLAGGYGRVFYISDRKMIEEDFENLKRTFYTCGEGLMNEEVMDREAEVVEGVIGLMGKSTEHLMEDFSCLICEASGMGMVTSGQKLPMPPTTGRWNKADPNTILRVLCHRNDKAANMFLKKSFQLARRK
ncbi:hypothetical protein Tsubulata_012626 [Turnera subulata]|uniref:MHD1 domain-containing protein n=1 Tax=Turnera subulata TaxID=218843 RepID=A0A9Q0JAW3_9ROSI|nr:hypothetical protein Tsubulata_012626 [Turnera subulata]